VFELIPHDDIVEDLERLAVEKPVVAECVTALIQQLLDDPILTDDLLRDKHGGSPAKPHKGAIFNVRVWEEAQQKGINLWRVRDFELSRLGYEFRIVYGVFEKHSLIYLLAVVEKEWDYDFSHPISRRIVASYSRIEDELW